MTIRNTRVVTMRSSSAQGSGASATNEFDVSDLAEAQDLLINVTAVSGTNPTLDTIVETSDDASTWYTHTTLAQLTAVSKQRSALTNFGKYLRLNPTVGGTATPTVTWTAKLVGKN